MSVAVPHTPTATKFPLLTVRMCVTVIVNEPMLMREIAEIIIYVVTLGVFCWF